ncbi:MAG TPA: multicopper oxidase domain-containing protein [Rhodopila sp.]|nr:multicopper oxidase domain-containing protein [Rhodopila sp.]
MTMLISRRGLLASASLAAAGASGGRTAAAPGPIQLTAERRVLDVNGKPATVFALRRPDGSPGLVLDPGQRFTVDLLNRCSDPTIVHWHGQTPPTRQDGVTDTGLETLIAPGASQGYDFAPRPGTHWMHSHHGLQEQRLMAAPLVVRAAADVSADVQEVTVLLHDFTFRDPEAILAELSGPAAMQGGGANRPDGSGHAANRDTNQDTNPGLNPALSMGAGTMYNMPVHQTPKPGAPMPGMAMSGMPMHDTPMHDTPMQDMPMHETAMPHLAPGGHAMPGMAMGGGTMQPAAPGGGMTGMVMDLNDIDFDAYLANERTLADPLVVQAERNGRVRLRLINGATSTAFWIDLGTLDGTVVAVDGDPVKPVAARRFPMAQGQRVDVIVRMPQGGGAFPVLAQREGDRQRTGIILATPGAAVVRIPTTAPQMASAVDLSLERRLQAVAPLAARPVNVVHQVTLAGSMKPYRWTIDGRSWGDHQALAVAQGQRVALDIVNRSQMAHPMHLHGHHFQVVALNGQAVAGAMRDTVLVPAGGSVRVVFDADNPGRWLFHCHNLYHMATGMMTEVAYAGFA